MGGVYDTLIGVFGDGSAMMLALLVFLADHDHGVRRDGGGARARRGQAARRRHRRWRSAATATSRSLRSSSLKAVQRLLDYTTKHYSASEKDKAT